jgi:hypothetical protein
VVTAAPTSQAQPFVETVCLSVDSTAPPQRNQRIIGPDKVQVRLGSEKYD